MKLVISYPKVRFYFVLLPVLLLAAASFAQVGIGASVSAGSRFIVGGRLKFAPQNKYIPQPTLSITGTPLTKKRLLRINTAEYMQLHEKVMYFNTGILEQLFLNENVGLEAELSLGIVEGWYRGTERDYSTKVTPVVAVGPLFKLNDVLNVILRFQWYCVETANNYVGSLIFEATFR